MKDIIDNTCIISHFIQIELLCCLVRLLVFLFISSQWTLIMCVMAIRNQDPEQIPIDVLDHHVSLHQYLNVFM